LGRTHLQEGDTAAHTLLHAVHAGGTTLDYRSASGSTYLRRGDVVLRLSDHNLGYADHGTREQLHNGPEIIVNGRETPTDLAAAIEDAFMDCSSFAT